MIIEERFRRSNTNNTKKMEVVKSVAEKRRKRNTALPNEIITLTNVKHIPPALRRLRM